MGKVYEQACRKTRIDAPLAEPVETYDAEIARDEDGGSLPESAVATRAVVRHRCTTIGNFLFSSRIAACQMAGQRRIPYPDHSLRVG